MPRDASGNYTLPAGNPVVTGTTISTTWANPTMSDIAITLTDSLSRTGLGNMAAPLRGPDGSVSSPNYSWTNETSSGRYRAASGEIREAVLGVDILRYTSGGLEEWTGAVWQPISGATAATVPYDPSSSILTATNVQGALDEAADLISQATSPEAANVSYDDTLAYFVASDVQAAIDRLAIDLSNIELLPAVLPVARGGTGTTTSTGTGSVVLSNTATLSNADFFNADIFDSDLDNCDLNFQCTGFTQGVSNSSNALATTLFVKLQTVLTGNSITWADDGLIICWGKVADGATTINFPVTFTDPANVVVVLEERYTTTATQADLTSPTVEQNWIAIGY